MRFAARASACLPCLLVPSRSFVHARLEIGAVWVGSEAEEPAVVESEGPSGWGIGGPVVPVAPHVLPVEAKLDGRWRSEAMERVYAY